MKYINRHAQQAVEKSSKMFGATLVVGPRQVGKTTMLKKITKSINYVTLDDMILMISAKEQSNTFFKDNPPPIFIDEIQKVPELFPYIKMLIDSSSEKGQFYMCGSQHFQMMKGVSESLAGRIGIITLLGLSLREKYSVNDDMPFIPTDDYFNLRKKELIPASYDDIWNNIHRGSMPELYLNNDYDWQMFYGSYLRTYIERDVRELSEIGDSIKFTKFMSLVAAQTGNLLNIASLSKDVGISQPTAERWLSVLVSSNIVYLLRPYSNNILKRAVKTPKIYFLDTGLCAYLTRWNNPDVIKNGAMAGAFFESFVISEIIKSYYNKGVVEPNLYFYRDKDMNEIDLLIEDNGILYPIEIKKHADPTSKDVSKFDILKKNSNINVGGGGVICMYDNLVTLKDNFKAIPIKYL